MQHPDKHTFNIRLKIDETLGTDTCNIKCTNHCNIWNTPIYFYNIHMKHLQHTYEIFETFEMYSCNVRFQRKISVLFGRNGGSLACENHRCIAHRWRGATGQGGAIAIERGGRSGAALRFFDFGDGSSFASSADRPRDTAKPWIGTGRGQLPFVSLNPAMELRVITGPSRDTATLERTRQGVAADRPGRCDGAAVGLGAPPMGGLRTPGGAGEAGGQRRNPTVAALQSAVVVEHDCGAAVESLLKNGDSRIRLEANDKKIQLLDRWAGTAAHKSDRPERPYHCITVIWLSSHHYALSIWKRWNECCIGTASRRLSSLSPRAAWSNQERKVHVRTHAESPYLLIIMAHTLHSI
jgi:hypothetical protein